MCIYIYTFIYIYTPIPMIYGMVCIYIYVFICLMCNIKTQDSAMPHQVKRSFSCSGFGNDDESELENCDEHEDDGVVIMMTIMREMARMRTTAEDCIGSGEGVVVDGDGASEDGKVDGDDAGDNDDKAGEQQHSAPTWRSC